MKFSGFVLISVLIILSIEAMSVIIALESTARYLNLTSQNVRMDTETYLLEAVGHAIIANQLHECITDEKDPNRVLNLTQNQGCEYVISEHHFRFLISDLGQYLCLRINQHSSHHWLITVSTISMPRQILQIRYAMPESEDICKDEAHVIPGGIISWRVFEYVEH